jgi:hypothetical protein
MGISGATVAQAFAAPPKTPTQACSASTEQATNAGA